METRAPAAGRDPNAVAGLVTVVVAAASALMVATVSSAWHLVAANPKEFVTLLLVTLGLQAIAVDVYGRGTLSFAGTGLLAMSFAFGPGPAMLDGAAMAFVLLVVRRPKLHRALFDAANFALCGAAAGALYELFPIHRLGAPGQIGPSLLAAGAYLVINVGLLSCAMGLSEGIPPVEVWKERFRWRTPYYVVSGPLAVALTLAYDHVGITGLVAFTLPPLMMMFSVRQYVSRTRRSVEEVRAANEELSRANEELAARNQDLQELFQFAGGLAARAHDRSALVGYAESALTRLVGVRANVSVGFPAPRAGDALIAGGKEVGAVSLEPGFDFDEERWQRLRDAILPQLATAIESSELVEEVRKKHLATIAALSRSMEAKDYYTGGHTERVSSVAVALATRLGYGGPDLDAVEIGALLHDIGKIGIPERILHKAGPLDDDEWKVMKEHPIISEYILSEVDLPATVLQIARSSHERMDGKGYPDGLQGAGIPLPARIVLVADAWDALTSDRPYRRGRSVAEALQEMRAHAGTQFCPTVIAALERVYKEEPHLLGAAYLRAVEAGAA
jgi:putative nucleotidyltransferase with HDIG domain